MFKYFIAITSSLFISTLTLAEEWTGFSECGIYQVKGIARSTEKGLVIVVNEKSMSKLIIKVPIINETFLAPYVDNPISALVLFNKAPNGSQLSGVIQEIKDRIANPLVPEDTGIKLISSVVCKK